MDCVYHHFIQDGTSDRVTEGSTDFHAAEYYYRVSNIKFIF